MTKMGGNQYAQMYIGNDIDAAPKKRPPRRNPWGNSSYADLITQAIEASPEKKLTLSQIYDWMIRNIPHFSNQGASNSSAGWKNSIRHNLSLHEKFLRIKNEETNCKSSWWTVNQSGGTGRTSRRKNLSRRKTNKPSSQKSNAFFRKLTSLSPTNLSLSSSTFKACNQNKVTLLSSSKRKWRSCSSNSSEENESFHSLSSSNSPSSVEGEIVYREPFYSGQSRYTAINTNQPFNGFHKEFSSTISNANLQLNTDAFNYNQQNLNGVDPCYSLGNKFYSHYNNLQNPSSESYLKAAIVEENNFSVSREYFKSPHHLSGSYMTSEISNIDSIQNSIPDYENPNTETFRFTNFQSHIIQSSPVGTEAFNTNQNTFASEEPENLIQKSTYPPFPGVVMINDSLDSLNRNQLKHPYLKDNLEKFDLCFKNKVIAEVKIKNEPSESDLQCCQELTHELKANIYKEDNSSGFRDTILSQGQKFVNGIDYKYLGKHSLNAINKDQSDLVSIPIQDQSNLEKQFKDSIHKFQENPEKKKKRRVSTCSSIKENTENETQPDQVHDEINTEEESSHVVNNCDKSCLQEIKNTNSYIQNQEYISVASTKVESLYSNNYLSPHISLQEKSCINCTESINEKSKSWNKSKSVGKNMSSANLRAKISRLSRIDKKVKQETLENSQTRSENSEANTPRACNHENSSHKFIEINDEVNSKVNILISHMMNLVLQKVEDMSFTRLIVDYTLLNLHHLSAYFTHKQLLSILTELLFALNATRVHYIHGRKIFDNYNHSLSILLTSHFEKCLSLKDAIDLYLRFLPDVINAYISEKVLSDSRIKSMDFPPNIDLYLRLYQLDTKAAMSDAGGFKRNNDKVTITSDRSFILPSVSTGAINTSDTELHISVPEDNFFSYVLCNELYNNSEHSESHITHSQPLSSSQDISLHELQIQSKCSSVGRDFLKHKTGNNNINDAHKENQIINFNFQNNIPNSKELRDILPPDLCDIEIESDFVLSDCYLDFEFSKYDFEFDEYLKNCDEYVKNRR